MEVDHSSRRSGDSTADGHGKYLMSVRVHPFAGGDPFTLEGRKFSLSDTFSDIRNAIINQVEVSPDKYPDVFEFNDPKTDLLKLPGTCFPLEDHSTLGSVFGFGNPLYRPSTIDIRLFPAAVAKIGTPLPRPETRPPDLPDDGDHLDHDLFPKRPRIETLPFCAAIGGTSSTAAVIYDGVLELKSPEGYPLCFDDLEYRGSLYTSASCVLLTPSVGIWGILSTLNQDSKYLVIHVGWDRLSFLLPRVIKLFYPDMPFVAVTDLTPHQLDLLTFLDTSQHHVKYFYGWDILDEADDFGVYHIERLDIKWLGLRPSDLECFPASVFDQLVVKRLPHDFDNVLSKIQWNPYFSKNQAWVRELKLFKEYRKCVRFLPSGPLKNLVSNRLRNKDFV